ncbi:Uncharacterised protein [Candidatus Gugararchaeum adminiculabundum]|nr:Uncharacterised protein [Candidatus Gugararchaeum adminiculabundum]
MYNVKEIDENEAIAILSKDESHFLDFKHRKVSGNKFQRIACSFANSDGGEIYVGICDKKETPVSNQLDLWDGLENQEEANTLLQNLYNEISPSIEPRDAEFYKIKGNDQKGLVLRILIDKSPKIHYTSEKKVWVRKNAQCIEIPPQGVVDLQLSKGVTSYETQFVENFETENLESSTALRKFLDYYSPKSEPSEFLRKQYLIRKKDGKEFATYAAVLLFAETPSAILPKKCAVKISRYNTSENEPEREHLGEQTTVEGPLYQQISDAISSIKTTIGDISVLTRDGMAKAEYPADAIKEILVNAVIHRDYNISEDIQVFIFNNRIVIKSPGLLAGHVTTRNILEERFSRNNTIVRILNKFQNPPNKDIGEGLNTAFQKMKEVKLKPPIIEERDNSVLVTLPHEYLAAPEDMVLEYLEKHGEITNSIGRTLTGIKSENKMKNVFLKLAKRNLVERVPDKQSINSAWRKKRIEQPIKPST